jgi:serine/threonine-protein kinase
VVVSKGPEIVAVPDVHDLTLDDAKAAIVKAGFTVGDVTRDYDDKVAKDRVTDQDPSGGTAKRGTAISLTLSRGPEPVMVPDVTGKSFDQAKAALSSAGFVVVRNDDYSDSVPQGAVVSESPSGQREPRGTSVTVTVSKGSKPFAMPDLRGKDRATAKSIIAGAGLVVGSETAVPSSTGAKGSIQGQNPSPGAQVRKGDKVDLFYAA